MNYSKEEIHIQYMFAQYMQLTLNATAPGANVFFNTQFQQNLQKLYLEGYLGGGVGRRLKCIYLELSRLVSHRILGRKEEERVRKQLKTIVCHKWGGNVLHFQ